MQILGAFVWDQSGIRVIVITRVSVCLGAILIPEYLDFHSGYLLRKSYNNDVIVSAANKDCSGESVKAVERRKGFWWSTEDSLLLISQYSEHERRLPEMLIVRRKAFRSY